MVALRQGASNFNTVSAVAETLYVDQARLINSFSSNYFVDPSIVYSQSITSNRYQSYVNTKGIASTIPYYKLEVRPSGRVINTIKMGYTLQRLMGMIGGIFIIFLLVIGNCLSNFFHSCHIKR